jgi:argininosuccinate synthase
VSTPPKKVVLAYSGGLDTSIILKWLQTEYRAEVVTFTADLGQGRGSRAGAAQGRAARHPAGEHLRRDLREEFVRDFVFRCFAPTRSMKASICSAPRSRGR